MIEEILKKIPTIKEYRKWLKVNLPVIMEDVDTVTVQGSFGNLIHDGNDEWGYAHRFLNGMLNWLIKEVYAPKFITTPTLCVISDLHGSPRNTVVLYAHVGGDICVQAAIDDACFWWNWDWDENTAPGSITEDRCIQDSYGALASIVKQLVSLDRRCGKLFGEVRPEVQAFAIKMEEKLRRNDSMKGERGWKNCTLEYLAYRLEEEYKELKQIISMEKVKPDPAAVSSECADVANLAMMIDDNFGARMC